MRTAAEFPQKSFMATSAAAVLAIVALGVYSGARLDGFGRVMVVMVGLACLVAAIGIAVGLADRGHESGQD